MWGLQAEVKRLQALVRLEKDTVLALQQALEEARQSWGASESEANTALATSHSFEVPPPFALMGFLQLSEIQRNIK